MKKAVSVLSANNEFFEFYLDIFTVKAKIIFVKQAKII